jgi:hypothetical protein
MQRKFPRHQVLRSASRPLRCRRGRRASSETRSACASARPRLDGTICGLAASTLSVCRQNALRLVAHLVQLAALAKLQRNHRVDTRRGVAIATSARSCADRFNETRFCIGYSLRPLASPGMPRMAGPDGPCSAAFRAGGDAASRPTGRRGSEGSVAEAAALLPCRRATHFPATRFDAASPTCLACVRNKGTHGCSR